MPLEPHNQRQQMADLLYGLSVPPALLLLDTQWTKMMVHHRSTTLSLLPSYSAAEAVYKAREAKPVKPTVMSFTDHTISLTRLSPLLFSTGAKVNVQCMCARGEPGDEARIYIHYSHVIYRHVKSAYMYHISN